MNEELVGGNAQVEAGTFVAILIGTLAGGLLAGAGGRSRCGSRWPGWVVAVAGYLASRGIPDAPPPAPDLVVNVNPLTETWRNIGFARENRTVFLSILGISWFWLYGALFLAQFPAYAQERAGRRRGGGDAAAGYLHRRHRPRLAALRAAVGAPRRDRAGAVGVDRPDPLRARSGLSPRPAAASGERAICRSARCSASPASGGCSFDLLLLGMFGGFFIVPLYALVQLRSTADKRARIIAANNIINALFMVVGALVAAAMFAGGLSIPMLFAVAAICNAAVAVFIYGLVPEFLLRFLAWVLIHLFYRAEEARRRAHSARRRGADRLQPCQLRRSGHPDGGFAAADPLRDGSPHLPHAAHLASSSATPGRFRSRRPRRMRR